MGYLSGTAVGVLSEQIEGASGAASVMGVLLDQYSTSDTVGVLLEQFLSCTAAGVLLEQTVHIRYWPVCTPCLSGTAAGVH